MSEFLNEIRTVAATVESDTGAVVVTQSGFGRLTVRIDARKLNDHDEDSLSEEIEQAVSNARHDHFEQMQEVAERTGQLDKPIPRTFEVAWQLSEASHKIAELVAEETSLLKHVVVAAWGDGDLAVKFLHNAVRRTDIRNSVLESEVNEAITLAMRSLAIQVRELLESRKQ